MMLVRRLVLAVFGSVLLAVGVGGVMAAPVFATGDANEAFCPAETEASPGFRSYLPDCRAYELVTPPYKDDGLILGLGGGYPLAVSENGGRVLAMVGGAFAGAGNAWWQGNVNPYVDAYSLTRTASGWQPTALTPPATTYPYSDLMAASPDLGTTLWGATTNHAYARPTANEDIYLRSATGQFSLVGPGVAPAVAGEELSDIRFQLDQAGASRDLTRLLFSVQSASPNSHSDLWPGDTTHSEKFSLYEYSYHGAPSAEPALVGVKNVGPLHGSPLNEGAELISDCGTSLGANSFGGSTYNAVSASGEAVFFTAAACAGDPAVNELYARLGGEKTLAISEPILPPGEECTGACAAATHKAGLFEGASEDGSKVFFLTEQPLLNSDEDAKQDLYEAEIEGEGASAHLSDLVQVSHDPNSGQAAEVQGVVRVSEDGSHVYFVAKGVLAGENKATQESPVAGADNLYVYDTKVRETHFVATLLTPAEESSLEAAEAAELSPIYAKAFTSYEAREKVIEAEFGRGEISELRREQLLRAAENESEEFIAKTEGTEGPSGTLATDRLVWANADNRPAQASPDGRFLLFPSSADLTPGDTSTVPQLFRYDAATEALTRVSIGQGGAFERDGNVEAFHDAPLIQDQNLSGAVLPTATQIRSAMSDDGSRVFFTSADRLTPEAVPGVTNVYEYRDGDVYLISDGRDASTTEDGREPTVEFFGATPSGSDVFFTTADPLVPQVAENQQMLYDAREGGGFPAPAVPATCEGEACQGPTSVAPTTQPAGSSIFSGPGNLAPPPAPAPKVVASKPKLKSAKCKKGFAKKHGKCVKNKSKKRAKKAKRASHDRRAM
jgi:hypothetical protein